MLNCRVQVSSFRVHNKITTLNKNNFQLTEVIQVSKCVLPALILGVPIKLLALYDIVDTPLELTSSVVIYIIIISVFIHFLDFSGVFNTRSLLDNGL